MIRILLLSLPFTFLFFYLFGNDTDPILRLQKTWGYSKEYQIATNQDPRDKYEPQKHLNGFTTKDYYTNVRTGFKKSISDEERIIYPLVSSGFLEYPKIGSEIRFFSDSGELLWKKDSKSYPIFHPFGEPLFLVSGDRNQVIVMDMNGNPTGIEKANGRFLTEIAYANEKSITLLEFAGGEIFLINAKGEAIVQKNLGSQNELVFCKSAAVSPKGEKFAVHCLRGQSDMIYVLNQNGEEDYSFPLENNYPHKIHFALLDSGELLLHTEKNMILVDASGDPELVYEKKIPTQRQYHFVYSLDGKFFTERESDEFLIYDSEGKILYEEKIASGLAFSRLIPAGKDEGSGHFFVENKGDFQLYRFY